MSATSFTLSTRALHDLQKQSERPSGEMSPEILAAPSETPTPKGEPAAQSPIVGAAPAKRDDLKQSDELKRAAETDASSNSQKQFANGFLCETGRHFGSRYNAPQQFQPDIDLAIQYYLNAANQGHDQACQRLAQLYIVHNKILDLQKHIDLAASGNTVSAYLLGISYLRFGDKLPSSMIPGWTPGMTLDQMNKLSKETSQQYFMQAERDPMFSTTALFWAGCCSLELHKYSPEKALFKEARELFERAYNKAYNKKESNATVLLGICYASGLGGTRDTEKAKELFLESAHAGNPYAMYELGRLISNDETGAEAFEEGITWITKSSDLQNGTASFHLAELYEKGRADKGVAIDLQKSIHFYERMLLVAPTRGEAKMQVQARYMLAAYHRNLALEHLKRRNLTEAFKEIATAMNLCNEVIVESAKTEGILQDEVDKKVEKLSVEITALAQACREVRETLFVRLQSLSELGKNFHQKNKQEQENRTYALKALLDRLEKLKFQGSISKRKKYTSRTTDEVLSMVDEYSTSYEKLIGEIKTLEENMYAQFNRVEQIKQTTAGFSEKELLELELSIRRHFEEFNTLQQKLKNILLEATHAMAESEHAQTTVINKDLQQEGKLQTKWFRLINDVEKYLGISPRKHTLFEPEKKASSDHVKQAKPKKNLTPIKTISTQDEVGESDSASASSASYIESPTPLSGKMKKQIKQQNHEKNKAKLKLKKKHREEEEKRMAEYIAVIQGSKDVNRPLKPYAITTKARPLSPPPQKGRTATPLPLEEGKLKKEARSLQSSLLGQAEIATEIHEHEKKIKQLNSSLIALHKLLNEKEKGAPTDTKIAAILYLVAYISDCYAELHKGTALGKIAYRIRVALFKEFRAGKIHHLLSNKTSIIEMAQAWCSLIQGADPNLLTDTDKDFSNNKLLVELYNIGNDFRTEKLTACDCIELRRSTVQTYQKMMLLCSTADFSDPVSKLAKPYYIARIGAAFGLLSEHANLHITDPHINRHIQRIRKNMRSHIPGWRNYQRQGCQARHAFSSTQMGVAMATASTRDSVNSGHHTPLVFSASLGVTSQPRLESPAATTASSSASSSSSSLRATTTGAPTATAVVAVCA